MSCDNDYNKVNFELRTFDTRKLTEIAYDVNAIDNMVPIYSEALGNKRHVTTGVAANSTAVWADATAILPATTTNTISCNVGTGRGYPARPSFFLPYPLRHLTGCTFGVQPMG